MSFNFIVPQSPAGAVPALYYVPPSVLQYQQPPSNPTSVTAYRQFFGKSSTLPVSFLHPKFKTEICNKYDSKYGCPYGEQCQFRHPEDPTPPEAILNRMSQITVSEGSNSVSSNASMNASLINRSGRYVGRSSSDNRTIFTGKSVIRSQRNSRQLLPSKGNISCSPSNRRSLNNFSVSEDPRTNRISISSNGGSGNNGANGNKSFCRSFLGKSSSSQVSFLHPKFKTEVCNKYNSKYGCPYGEQCQFRHPEDPTPAEAIIARMSQITISEDSNNVSSMTSMSGLAINRGSNYVERNQIGGSGDCRGIISGKTMFRPQYNGRQVLKTKGNNMNLPAVRHQSNKGLAVNKNEKVNGNCANKPQDGQFFNEMTFPSFLKFVNKVPKNGMRRYNSQETIGMFTYAEISKFKKNYH